MDYLLIFKSKRYNVGKNEAKRLLQLLGCKQITFPVLCKHKVIKFVSDMSKENIEEYMINNCEFVEKIIEFDSEIHQRKSRIKF